MSKRYFYIFQSHWCYNLSCYSATADLPRNINSYCVRATSLQWHEQQTISRSDSTLTTSHKYLLNCIHGKLIILTMWSEHTKSTPKQATYAYTHIAQPIQTTTTITTTTTTNPPTVQHSAISLNTKPHTQKTFNMAFTITRLSSS